MWRNRSLIYPAIIFLLLAIGATLAVGYTVNFAILEDVLQERMARQAQQVGSDVLHALENKVHQLEQFKDSWMENASWSRTNEIDSAPADKRVNDSLDLMWKQHSELFPLWGIDFIMLLDPTGHIIHRMPADFGSGHAMPTKLLDQIRTETAQNRTVWHVAQVAQTWQMMLFAPIQMQTNGESHVVVFGQGLPKIVAQLLRENPDRPFMLAAIDGIAAGSPTLLTGAQFHLETAAKTIRENKPRMVFDSNLPTNLYYTPIPFLDQVFSLVVPVSLDAVRQVLANSRQRLIGSMGFIIVLLIGLAIGLERILLRPLRHLRNKAAIMVQACSRTEQTLHFNPDEHGNEILMLEKAMEEASIKLYAHVAHLVDTKQLLEGLTLKDPVTLLGNRRMLDEFLGLTLGTCKRKQRQVAVILLEPESIENYPELLTTEEQNQILREMANRLIQQLRGEDLAFRLQKNEFVAFAPECGDEEQVLSLVFRLHRALTKPYSLTSQRTFTLDIRLGVAVFPGAGEDVDSLLQNARIALIKARSGIRYAFSIFNYPQATADNAVDTDN